MPKLEIAEQERIDPETIKIRNLVAEIFLRALRDVFDEETLQHKREAKKWLLSESEHWGSASWYGYLSGLDLEREQCRYIVKRGVRPKDLTFTGNRVYKHER